MRALRTLQALGLAAAVAAPAAAGWLELGPAFVEWDAGAARVYDLAPATPEVVDGPVRVAGRAPHRVEVLSEDDRLLLVAAKHHDPRPELAEVARVLVDAGGELLIVADAEGRQALTRMQHTHGDHLHLIVRPAPEGAVVRRVWDRRALATLAPVDPGLADVAAKVSAERWAADVQTLVDFGTRNSRKPEIWQAAEWARERLASHGFDAEVETFSWWGTEAPNVVARRFVGAEGEEPPRPIFLIGAHLDSINYGSTTAPGADDNASGTAGVLELARLVPLLFPEDPGMEVRLALFSGEEQGLHGSKAMAKKMAENGELPRVKAMINLDMIAFDQGGPLEVTLESKAFNQSGLDRMAALAAAYTELVVTTTTHAWGSDHVPFLQRGVPAVLPIEGEYDDNPNDHTGRDLPQTTNPALAREILRLVLATLHDAAP